MLYCSRGTCMSERLFIYFHEQLPACFLYFGGYLGALCRVWHLLIVQMRLHVSTVLARSVLRRYHMQ